jgi:hypothetical protein
MTRDIPRKKYIDRMFELGFRPTGFMGYWTLPEPYNHSLVSDLNAGDNRRAKLAYMLKVLDEEKRKK